MGEEKEEMVTQALNLEQFLDVCNDCPKSFLMATDACSIPIQMSNFEPPDEWHPQEEKMCSDDCQAAMTKAAEHCGGRRLATAPTSDFVKKMKKQGRRSRRLGGHTANMLLIAEELIGASMQMCGDPCGNHLVQMTQSFGCASEQGPQPEHYADPNCQPHWCTMIEVCPADPASPPMGMPK